MSGELELIKLTFRWASFNSPATCWWCVARQQQPVTGYRPASPAPPVGALDSIWKKKKKKKKNVLALEKIEPLNLTIDCWWRLLLSKIICWLIFCFIPAGCPTKVQKLNLPLSKMKWMSDWLVSNQRVCSITTGFHLLLSVVLWQS